MKIGLKGLLVIGVMAAGVLGTQPASACLRAMEAPAEKDKPDQPHLVAQAEQNLEAGKLAVATLSMVKTFPTLRDLERPLTPLENRAIRIVALASVRSDGGYGVASGKGPARNLANLDWAVTALRKLNAARAGDASLQADLGEALAKVPATQKEALEMLSKLASDDLIGSPHAYAALAKLQAAAGDAAKSADAIKRCEGMTSTPAICKPGKPTPPAAPPAKPKESSDDLKSRA